MLHVEVKPRQESVVERSGVSQKTGKEYLMREQSCYVDLGGDYPVEIKINLEEGQPVYKAGNYNLCHSSFRVDGYGRLMVNRIRLIPA
ncbi:single-stranded DNA-binding protein [Escherichia coli]|uniref:single-stranded DNA-binding protein n=1 Tax=Escherichia coli TaxID=562 RepID=UPI002FD47C35